MRQFYEAYRGNAKGSALLRLLPWTHNLIILSQSKRPEEREFYLRMAVQERWSSREPERQFKTALFERVVLSPVKVSPVVRQSHPLALVAFKDAYMVEFLGLPEGHSESDLQRGLLAKLKAFLIELGREVQTVVPTRAKLIDKGMIYSPSHGDTGFTVPLFDAYMRRVMPELG